MLCLVREVALFFPVELEFHRLEFHWEIMYFLFCSIFLCLVLKPFTGNAFFIFFLDMQANQKLKCVHAQNVIHKYSLTGKEAENVNALKLHQNAFSIGTKLQKLLRTLHKHGFTMQMHLHRNKRHSQYQHFKHAQPRLICSSNHTTQITIFIEVHWIENYKYIQQKPKSSHRANTMQSLFLRSAVRTTTMSSMEACLKNVE